jgi:hypothetical protein
MWLRKGKSTENAARNKHVEYEDILTKRAYWRIFFVAIWLRP